MVEPVVCCVARDKHDRDDAVGSVLLSGLSDERGQVLRSIRRVAPHSVPEPRLVQSVLLTCVELGTQRILCVSGCVEGELKLIVDAVEQIPWRSPALVWGQVDSRWIADAH